MPDERHVLPDDPLIQYWDDLVQAGPPASTDLNPAVVDAIRGLGLLDDVPAPTPTFVTRLREDLMDATPSSRPGSSTFDFPLISTPNGRIAHPLPPSPLQRDRSLGRWGRPQLATAAFLMLMLAGSIVVFGPGRFGRQQESPVSIPAISATLGTADPAERPVAEFLWETTGGPDLPLGSPGFPALDPQGTLWVPDSAHDRFQIFSPDGTFLETWGESGSGDGQFEFELNLYHASAIAFSPDGSFYVVDPGNRRIQTFGPDRSFVTAWGGEGIGPGQFKVPEGIAVDGQGRVYVTDNGRNDVQVFDADGAYLRTIGERGFKDGQFFFANGSNVHIDPTGNVWVSDGSNHRIQVFSPDGELLFVRRGGPGKHQLGKPGQLAVDEEGRLFVTAPELQQVQVFAPDGSYLGAWGGKGLEAGEFTGPSGLVLGPAGDIYVSSYDDSRVQKFRLLPPLAPG